jgi:hypothetical protein
MQRYALGRLPTTRPEQDAGISAREDTTSQRLPPHSSMHGAEYTSNTYAWNPLATIWPTQQIPLPPGKYYSNLTPAAPLPDEVEARTEPNTPDT